MVTATFDENWYENFQVEKGDLEVLTNAMMETEAPMTSRDLAMTLVQRKVQQQSQPEKMDETSVPAYDPAKSYTVGIRLRFPQFDDSVGEVVHQREGTTPDGDPLNVIGVTFRNDGGETSPVREFASDYAAAHSLNAEDEPEEEVEVIDVDVDDLLMRGYKPIMTQLLHTLYETEGMVRIGKYWFLRDLLLDVDIGTLHLAEAVLDMNGGGPMTAEEILDTIGDIGAAPRPMQAFSLNMALNRDDRFDEVGSYGNVRWYIKRMEPEQLTARPEVLQFNPIEYDEEVLTDEQFDLETELDDELTDIVFEGKLSVGSTTLIYPHRRAGTLPLNAKMRQIFPGARTERIFVELVDAIDQEVFNGWVVHEHQAVYGLWDFYTKHQLPVGSYIKAERDPNKEDRIIISFADRNARREWVRVLIPSGGENFSFENRPACYRCRV